MGNTGGMRTSSDRITTGLAATADFDPGRFVHVLRLERLTADHAPGLLAFERENRAYFARSISDRGDEYFAQFAARHALLLEFQEAGTDHLHVILDDDRIVGRVNLIDVTDGTAELGYRVAESAAGQGVATFAVREVCALARTRYHLHHLTAVTTADNLPSRKVLQKTGFIQTSTTHIGGRPGFAYVLDLCGQPGPDPMDESQTT
jgi:RimJ/RimL family protein N-acetyltransferase